MPRGTPDGRISVYEYASTEADPSAIYNMLWGFSPLDARGRVVYLDTFNNGLGGFGTTNTGAALAPVLNKTPSSNSEIFIPPASVKCDPGVNVNDLSQIWRQLYLGVNLRLGLEAAIRFSLQSPSYRLIVDYKPNNRPGYIARLQVNAANTQWQIFDQTGAAVDIFPVNAGGAPPNFPTLQQVKIVADWDSGKYVRAMIGENIIDLSAYSMQASAVTYNGFLVFALRAVSNGAGTNPGFFGYTLLTKDEP